MKEFIDKTTENLEEKIKVTSLEIIVTGTKDKPYFEIKYREVGKEDYSIGYSSYDLNYVFAWKEECFEIVNELAEEYKVSEMPTGWIPCSVQEEPTENGKYIVWVQHFENKDLYSTDYVYWFGEWTVSYDWNVIAWMPVAPYTEGE